MLNNDKQIQKLINFCLYLFQTKKPKNVFLFFDEGDTVSKTDNTFTIVSKDPISHKKWIELHDLIRDNTVDYFKRIFISATPENCQYLYDIPLENIFKLTKPSTYRSISLHIEWNDELQPFISEVNRITQQGSREVILYCVDMINTNQESKARELGRYVKCPIIVYNANSITVRKYINGKWYRYNTKQTISDLLADLQKESDGPVVVVGYKLMDRGLSYVSSIPRDVDDKPLTATIMFFHGGNTAHTVGITQRFGRITGTSRPDIMRRVVYCKKTFYDAYEKYLQNQKKFQELCELSPKNATFAEMMQNIQLNNLQRPLDRPSLKRVNSYYKECSSSDSDNISDYSSDVQEERMKQLIDMWWNKDTIIGKILKFVYESGSVSETELKEFISDLNADNTWYNDLHHKNKYYINVFERSQNRITKLNEKAVHYINIRYT